jgi:hypothetical protein
VDALKRALYVQAGLWALAGVALSVAPKLVLVTLFDQPPVREFAWVRLLGVQTFALAMLMVLVAHRVDDLWWWSWAFAAADVGVALIVVLNLAFGLAPRQSAALWWVLSAITVGFALWVLFGLYVSSRERPIPD